MSTTKFYESDLGTVDRPINTVHVNNINGVPVAKVFSGIGMKTADGTVVSSIVIPNDVSGDSGTVILSDVVTPPISGTLRVPGGLASKKSYKLNANYIFSAPGTAEFRLVQFLLRYNGIELASVSSQTFPVVANVTELRIEAHVIVSDISDGQITTNGTLSYQFVIPGSPDIYQGTDSVGPYVVNDPGTYRDTGFELYTSNNGDGFNVKLVHAVLEY